MRRVALFTLTLLIICISSSCCTMKKKESKKTGQAAFVTGPKAVIYQTVKDYSQLVPIQLSDDKKTIESYPDVTDVYYNGMLAYPGQLHKGYWLDNRGIGKNVAFIKLTYEEYSKLPATPSAEELMNMIIDDQPLISMYSCGLRTSYKDIEKELNTKIDKGDYSAFTKIK